MGLGAVYKKLRIWRQITEKEGASKQKYKGRTVYRESLVHFTGLEVGMIRSLTRHGKTA